MRLPCLLGGLLCAINKCSLFSTQFLLSLKLNSHSGPLAGGSGVENGIREHPEVLLGSSEGNLGQRMWKAGYLYLPSS